MLRRKQLFILDKQCSDKLDKWRGHACDYLLTRGGEKILIERKGRLTSHTMEKGIIQLLFTEKRIEETLRKVIVYANEDECFEYYKTWASELGIEFKSVHDL